MSKISCRFVVQDRTNTNLNAPLTENIKKQAGQEGESPSFSPLWRICNGSSCGDPVFIHIQKSNVMQDERTNALTSAIVMTMTSREIADSTGKRHADVLEAIRTMEPAWVSIGQRNFSLMFSLTQLPNGGERKDPFYQLSKTECLYIATKFNDEARARLIIRWEQLENSTPKLPSTKELAMMVIAAEEEKERLQVQTQLQQKQLKEAAPKVKYYEEILQADDLIQTTIIAKELGMSAGALNKNLKSKGILYKSGDTWVLSWKHQNKGYTGTKTHHYLDDHGNTKTAIHTYWTQKGREFLIEKFKGKPAAPIYKTLLDHKTSNL